MKKNITISDIRIIENELFLDSRGALCPIEFSKLPIDINRMFYVYGVRDRKERGKHSHFKTNQILICLAGSCKVTCKDGKDEVEYTLSEPSKCLFIPRMIWDEQVYETDDTILLVLSDTDYDKSDYIEDWEQYIKVKRGVSGKV